MPRLVFGGKRVAQSTAATVMPLAIVCGGQVKSMFVKKDWMQDRLPMKESHKTIAWLNERESERTRCLHRDVVCGWMCMQE